jgi:hypothetical protein
METQTSRSIRSKPMARQVEGCGCGRTKPDARHTRSAHVNDRVHTPIARKLAYAATDGLNVPTSQDPFVCLRQMAVQNRDHCNLATSTDSPYCYEQNGQQQHHGGGLQFAVAMMTEPVQTQYRRPVHYDSGVTIAVRHDCHSPPSRVVQVALWRSFWRADLQ